MCNSIITGLSKVGVKMQHLEFCTLKSVEIKKDLSFLIGLNSLTWLRYLSIRGLTKHHIIKVTMFVSLSN